MRLEVSFRRVEDTGAPLGWAGMTTVIADRRYAAENREVRQEVLGERTPALTVIITRIFDPRWLGRNGRHIPSPSCRARGRADLAAGGSARPVPPPTSVRHGRKPLIRTTSLASSVLR
jgi:hypothetical protein